MNEKKQWNPIQKGMVFNPLTQKYPAITIAGASALPANTANEVPKPTYQRYPKFKISKKACHTHLLLCRYVR